MCVTDVAIILGYYLDERLVWCRLTMRPLSGLTVTVQCHVTLALRPRHHHVVALAALVAGMPVLTRWIGRLLMRPRFDPGYRLEYISWLLQFTVLLLLGDIGCYADGSAGLDAVQCISMVPGLC